MSTFTRRRFLVLAGAGIAALGGGALVLWQRGQSATGGILSFQAITALPRAPLPAYASYVIDGRVNLGTRTGTITRTVFAGAPQQRLPIPLLARTIRVTDMQDKGASKHITGVVTDQSQLQPGEGTSFEMTIDSARQLAQTDFFGDPIQLNVERLDIS
jgi:hypothetical protein